ncbi:MAG: tetratricopeptide repeat protein [Proteobacteria bacterium]|nr:tetratricopeptide repeat protein [Pseudomonadota bacterium]
MLPLSRTFVAIALLASAGCSLQPFHTQPPTTPTKPATQGGSGPVISEPPTVTSTLPAEPAIQGPAPSIPVPRERSKVAPATLSPASKALVSQAQAQRKKGDLPGASGSLDRALRIEPNNPLLWIEMGRLRMDQRNYAQAESMGRKALSMAVGDNHTQAAAWQLIADSLRARGKNPQAQEALDKANELGIQ